MPKQKETVGTGDTAKQSRLEREALLQRIQDKTESDYVMNGMTQPESQEEEQEEEEVEDKPDPAGEQEEQQADEGEDETQETVDKNDQETYKLEVNGKIVEVTKDELIRRAQMGMAAEEKFQEAARLRKEQAPPVKDEPAAVEEDDRALARAIQMGTEEEAAQAIRKVKSRPSGVSDDLARQIDERLSFQQAVSKAQEEYKDIFADPYLHKLFLEEDSRLIQSGDRRPYGERYESIGKDLRKWVESRGPKTPNDKLKRKASVTPIKAAGGRQAQATEEEEEDHDSFQKNSMRELLASRGRR